MHSGNLMIFLNIAPKQFHKLRRYLENRVKQKSPELFFTHQQGFAKCALNLEDNIVCQFKGERIVVVFLTFDFVEFILLGLGLIL